ncbi:hypothetical protein CTAYLR_003630 [Chrysophaeum taylorii]|uniref:PDZ domain-containing protein n=1 Tax=Chrysophaeum taylorii TaxID=2483200 RepID=A0AAD7XL24_9STRA|nr:hypothetical protein CTAYLR_003630 [Chrysophaeum taylorii]
MAYALRGSLYRTRRNSVRPFINLEDLENKKRKPPGGSLRDAALAQMAVEAVEAYAAAAEATGEAYEAVFEDTRLGLTLALARRPTEAYGDRPWCKLTVEDAEPATSIVKPTDELVKINGKAVAIRDDAEYDDVHRVRRFTALKKAVRDAPRPLRLTFVRGRRRELAWLENVNRKSMACHDRAALRRATALEGEALRKEARALSPGDENALKQMRKVAHRARTRAIATRRCKRALCDPAFNTIEADATDAHVTAARALLARRHQEAAASRDVDAAIRVAALDAACSSAEVVAREAAEIAFAAALGAARWSAAVRATVVASRASGAARVASNAAAIAARTMRRSSHSFGRLQRREDERRKRGRTETRAANVGRRLKNPASSGCDDRIIVSPPESSSHRARLEEEACEEKMRGRRRVAPPRGKNSAGRGGGIFDDPERRRRRLRSEDRSNALERLRVAEQRIQEALTAASRANARVELLRLEIETSALNIAAAEHQAVTFEARAFLEASNKHRSLGASTPAKKPSPLVGKKSRPPPPPPPPLAAPAALLPLEEEASLSSNTK